MTDTPSLGAMNPSGSPRRVGRRVALLAGLSALVVAQPALAADRVVWKRRTVKEVDGSWKISMQIHLSRAPDVPHIPVRFSFKRVMHFERALVDGRDGPVTRKITLQHQQPIVESVDAGFMDPASGKTARRTRFSFRVTRERGFEAGRYEVEVTNSRTGKKMGGKVVLTLDGENEVVDRRSIVFDGKPKEKKSDEPAAAAAREKELTPEDDAFWSGGPREPEEPDSPLPPPAHLREKPGCGCRVAGDAHSSASRLSFAAWVLAGGVLLGRRRARSSGKDGTAAGGAQPDEPRCG